MSHQVVLLFNESISGTAETKGTGFPTLRKCLHESQLKQVIPTSAPAVAG
jgi:hypothetical protein